MAHANACFTPNNYKNYENTTETSKTGKNKERDLFDSTGSCLNAQTHPK